MDNVLICPASGALPSVHYVSTIENSRTVSDVQRFLNEDERQILRHIYPDGSLWVWGMRPSNAGRWNTLDTDDEAIFYRNGAICSRCRVTLKTRNEPLADYLWKRDADNEPFEYIFFLARPVPIRMPLREFNSLIGVLENAPVQRTNLYTGARAEKLLRALESKMAFTNDTAVLTEDLT